MMLPLQEILRKYNVSVKGVIHVGAHWAEEHGDYMECGIRNVIYIEPCKAAYKVLVEKFCVRDAEEFRDKDYVCIVNIAEDSRELSSVCLLNYACSDKDGTEAMYVSHQNQGQSNSLLKPELHLEQHREVVFNDAEAVLVRRLDDLMNKYIFVITPVEERKERYNALVMDVQGAEGLVMRGATETLRHVDIVYTECNRGQTYSGNMEIDEMDGFLKSFGFERVETHWPSPNLTWGDAVYIRKSILNGIL